MTTSRPKRICKQKKFYIEESELTTRRKKVKTSIRKKRPSSQISMIHHLTDAEIEQQFGERLPAIKSEDDADSQQTFHNQITFEFEPVSHSLQTPIEKARSKLLNALERKDNAINSTEIIYETLGGHNPDSYLLKIRSREHKIIEVELAIYSTTEWHANRVKILSKIEEVCSKNLLMDTRDEQFRSLSTPVEIK